MQGYLGETVIDINNTPFKGYTSFDWAIYFIERYGQIDGEHHKLWVLDQVVRIHKGAQPVIKLARWDNGMEEYRVSLGEVTSEYKSWLEDRSHFYDSGIAP